MYTSVAELLDIAEKGGNALWEVVLDNEMRLSERSEAAIFDRLGERYDIMCRSAERALEGGLGAVGGLIDGVAHRQYRHAGGAGGIMGGELNRLMARALSCSETNAAMGKICAAPTAGACGVLPAVLITVSERFGADRRVILEALLTASGIGAVIMRNATVSGAEGGCQAECGVAAAMAAAAAVQMAGGAPRMSVDACAFALINCMGLICDPVAGLVQFPCAQRNASQAVNAVLSADMALAGMPSAIPADEAIDAMARTGRMLPMQLKETALGGVAATPSGRAAAKRILSDG